MCLYAFDCAHRQAKVVACSRVKCLKTRQLSEREKISLHPSIPLSSSTLVYLGHIMFGLTAVPVTGCMLPACRVKRRSRRKTDLSVLEPLIFGAMCYAHILSKYCHLESLDIFIFVRHMTPPSADVFKHTVFSRCINSATVFFKHISTKSRMFVIL